MKKPKYKERIPAPEGTHRAVLVDYVDLGVQETKFGLRDTIALVFEIDKLVDDLGVPFSVQKRYTYSFADKANLYNDLTSWGIKMPPDAKRMGFDLEGILGRPCLLNVVHKKSNDMMFANIMSVMPIPDGLNPLEPSGTYTRVLDRDESWDERVKVIKDHQDYDLSVLVSAQLRLHPDYGENQEGELDSTEFPPDQIPF